MKFLSFSGKKNVLIELVHLSAEPGMVVHTSNPSIQAVETRFWAQVSLGS